MRAVCPSPLVAKTGALGRLVFPVGGVTRGEWLSVPEDLGESMLLLAPLIPLVARRSSQRHDLNVDQLPGPGRPATETWSERGATVFLERVDLLDSFLLWVSLDVLGALGLLGAAEVLVATVKAHR